MGRDENNDRMVHCLGKRINSWGPDGGMMSIRSSGDVESTVFGRRWQRHHTLNDQQHKH